MTISYINELINNIFQFSFFPVLGAEESDWWREQSECWDRILPKNSHSGQVYGRRLLVIRL